MTNSELEVYKAKAAALDRAVAYLQGQIDSEKLVIVDQILHSWNDDVR
jgi:hypothetical protein